jgi:lipopolysaccharide heptosyltransferase II
MSSRTGKLTRSLKIISAKYVYKKPFLRLLARLFDAAGALLFFWTRRGRKSEGFRRILVIRLDQLGDAVLALPAVSALKKCFPAAEIDFFSGPWARELAEYHPDINRVFVFEHSYFSARVPFFSTLTEWLGFILRFRRNRYDLAVDFRGDVRTNLLMFFSGAGRRVGRGITGGGFLLTDLVPETPSRHQIERNLDCVRILGCEVEAPPLELYYPPATLGILRQREPEFFAAAVRPWIVVHIGSGYPSKRWPAANFFRLIDQILASWPGSVILVGQESERRLAEPFLRKSGRIFNLIGRTTITELCAILDSADVYVGNDSGPTHMAALLGKKVIVLFSGTNEAEYWRPLGKAVTVVRRPVPCSPCHERDCPLPRHDCMENITVEEVLEKVREAVCV